jgi:hypothetical protein
MLQDVPLRKISSWPEEFDFSITGFLAKERKLLRRAVLPGRALDWRVR